MQPSNVMWGLDCAAVNLSALAVKDRNWPCVQIEWHVQICYDGDLDLQINNSV